MNAVESPVGYQRNTSGRKAFARACVLAQASLAVFGLAVLLLIAFPSARDTLANQAAQALRATQPAGIVNFAAGPIQLTSVSPLDLEQRAVTEMLAKRYRVAQEAVAGFVATAYRAGSAAAIDPLLILAVISVESKFNPVAESTYGARGLMQVIPRFHMEKLVEHGGEESLLDPDINIQVGTRILLEYMRRFGGLQTALQAYGGAFDEPTLQYASKVLSERSRIEQVVTRLRRST